MPAERYGGFWRRLLAFAIDQAILTVCALLLVAVALLALASRGLLPGGAAGMALSEHWPFAMLLSAAIQVTGMGYFTWFHGAGGRTPGKMLLGLRVVQGAGGMVGFGTAFLRTVGYLVSGSFFGLGFLWVLWDRRKQGWHDKIAATVVVRAGGCDGGSGAPDGGPATVPDGAEAAPGSEKGLDKETDIG